MTSLPLRLARIRWCGVVALAVAGLAAAQRAASQTQPPAKPHRIGIVLPGLVTGDSWRELPVWRASFEGMRELGHVEGRSFVLELRGAGGKSERLPVLAAEVVATKPDVLFSVVCGAPLDAWRRATNTIPIVVATCNDDMVASGIVASLARPGGNVTGAQKLTPELSAKRLEMLKQLAPQASRVAVLWDPGYSTFVADWRELHAAARTLGVTLIPVEARATAELERAFAGALAQQADALTTMSDTITYVSARRIAELAAAHRLPAITPYVETVKAGGLIAYGPNLAAMFRRSAAFVDKLFKGAKAADLPVEQPTRFELVINPSSAKALGITIPQSLMIRADEVIE